VVPRRLDLARAGAGRERDRHPQAVVRAFYGTPLQTILTNLGRDTIVICGTLTNFCCGTTARQGYERGFNVVVVGDLTATDDRELHEAELKTLRKGLARVLSLEGYSLAELPQSVSPR
jgi:nicotinamidase-related amidase